MASPLSVIGGIVGLFGGGTSQITGSAAAAKVSQEYANTRQRLLDSFKKLGEKLAPTIGPDFFNALAQGASPAAEAARTAASQQYFGVDITAFSKPGTLVLAGLGIFAAVAAGIWLFRRVFR